MAGSRVKARPVAETVAVANGAVADPLAGLPRRPVEELDELARAQGVPMEADFDGLVGGFWPEDESCDEFIATYRRWRHAGRNRPR